MDKILIARGQGTMHVNDILKDIVDAPDNHPCRSCRYRDRTNGQEPCYTCVGTKDRFYHLRELGEPKRE